MKLTPCWACWKMCASVHCKYYIRISCSLCIAERCSHSLARSLSPTTQAYIWKIFRIRHSLLATCLSHFLGHTFLFTSPSFPHPLLSLSLSKTFGYLWYYMKQAITVLSQNELWIFTFFGGWECVHCIGMTPKEIALSIYNCVSMQDTWEINFPQPP